MKWIAVGLGTIVVSYALSWFTLRRIRARSQALAAGLQEKYGADLLRLSGGGIITSYNRVPGVLALTRDAFLYSAAITKDEGSIPLATVDKIVMQATRNSDYPRARKYRKAVVMALHLQDGDCKLFVISQEDYAHWRIALARKGIQLETDRPRG